MNSAMDPAEARRSRPPRRCRSNLRASLSIRKASVASLHHQSNLPLRLCGFIDGEKPHRNRRSDGASADLVRIRHARPPASVSLRSLLCGLEDTAQTYAIAPARAFSESSRVSSREASNAYRSASESHP